MKICKLENNLKYVFKNKELLIEAITHKSYSKTNNEKLEFLGDSILSFIITKNIYNIFPKFNEGKMSKIRSFLINSNIIIKISKKLNINNFICIKNFSKNDKIPDSIIENTFESIIGAIYLDKGFNVTEKFILKNYSKYLNLILKYSLKVIKDNKTTLQEISKKIFFNPPIYILNKIKKYKCNKKIFYVTCKLFNKNLCFKKNGIGFNKKSAEKLSAKKMISFIKYKKLI